MAHWYNFPGLVIVVVTSSTLPLSSLAQPDNGGESCLPNATRVEKRKNVMVGDVEMPLGIWYLDWDSAALAATIFKLLAEEVLGYNSSFSGSHTSSASGLYSTAGCKEPANYKEPQCESVESTTHLALEVWGLAKIATMEKALTEKYNLPQAIPDNLGSIGYDGVDGLFVKGPTKDLAWQNEGLALAFFKSYDPTWSKSWTYFARWTDFELRDLQNCSETRLNNPVEMDMYIKITKDEDGIIRNGEEITPRCWNKSWWLAPACRSEPGTCIPVLTRSSWGLLDFQQKAAKYNIPLALASVVSKSRYVSLIQKFSVLFYTFMPDSTFVDSKPSVIVFPRYDKHLWASGDRTTMTKDTPLSKWVWNRLKQVAPSAYVLANRYSISYAMINAMVSERAETGNSIPEVACGWVRANVNVWKRWIPDVADCFSGQGIVDPQGSYIMDLNNVDGCAWCMLGRYSVQNSSHKKYTCNLCPRGRFSKVNRATECQVAKRGKYVDREGQTGSYLCPIGSYADEEGQTACVECNQASASGVHDNSDTLPFTTKIMGASNQSQCLCNLGFYWSDQQQCVQCSESMGLHCKGDQVTRGDTSPILEKGFMALCPSSNSWEICFEQGASAPERFFIFLCPNEEYCPGGNPPISWSNMCAGKRRGIACAVCPQDHYPDKENCLECSEDSLQNLTIVCALAPIFFCYIYFRLNQDNTNSETVGKGERTGLTEQKTGELTKQNTTGPRKSSITLSSDSVSKFRSVTGTTSRSEKFKTYISIFLAEVFSVIKECFTLLLEFLQAATVVCSITGSSRQQKTMGLPGGINLGALGFLLTFDANTIFDMLGIKLACVLGVSFQARFLFNIVLPLVSLGCMLMNFLLYKTLCEPLQICLKQKAEGKGGFLKSFLLKLAGISMHWDKVVNALGAQVTTLFIGVTSLAMSLYASVPHPSNGDRIYRSVKQFPEVLVGSDEWSSLIPASIMAILVYTCGVLALASWVCWKAPHEAHCPRFRAKYFFLLHGYRANRWWWGLSTLVRGLLLNLTLVIFSSPKTQNIIYSMLFMISVAAIFTFDPWPTLVQNIVDTTSHLAIALLLAATSFYIRSDGSDGLEGNVASFALGLPLLTTVCCMALPLWHFIDRRPRSIRTYRHGQRMRDLFLLVTRRTNRELNEFLISLDDSDKAILSSSMSVLYSKMFFLHPSSKLNQECLITDTPKYRQKTDLKILLALERAIMVENREECESLRESETIEKFVEAILEGFEKIPKELLSQNPQEHRSTSKCSLKTLFQYLDHDGSGSLTEDEFIQRTKELNPKIQSSEALAVFKILDLANNGVVNEDEFDIVITGMTARGAALDAHVPKSKLLDDQVEQLREAKSRLVESLQKKRTATSQASVGGARWLRQTRVGQAASVEDKGQVLQSVGTASNGNSCRSDESQANEAAIKIEEMEVALKVEENGADFFEDMAAEFSEGFGKPPSESPPAPPQNLTVSCSTTLNGTRKQDMKLRETIKFQEDRISFLEEALRIHQRSNNIGVLPDAPRKTPRRPPLTF